METATKLSAPKRFVAALLCALLTIWGLSPNALGGGQAYAADVNIGTNPTPKVDIAVSLPSDYPGTFLEFKQELTQKLID